MMIHASRITAEGFEPSKEVLDHEKEHVEKFEKKLSGHIGWSAADFDLREDVIRTQESTFGNFMADLMRSELNSDVALINAGAFQADEQIPSGPISGKTLVSILPFPDTCALLRLTGSVLKQVLEHAVSGYEEKEGRFPCISGFSFKFDPSKP